MRSGSVIPVVLEKENAVTCLRQLVGATDPAEAACGTIRHDYGLNVQRNSVHASDAEDTAAKEIEFFFLDRTRGTSKLTLHTGIETLWLAWWLRIADLLGRI